MRSAARDTHRSKSSADERAHRHRILVLVEIVIVAAATIVLVVTTLHYGARGVRWLWWLWTGGPADPHDSSASDMRRCRRNNGRDRPCRRAASMTLSDAVSSKRAARGARKSPAKPSRLRSSSQRGGGAKYSSVVAPSADAAAVLAMVDVDIDDDEYYSGAAEDF